MPVSGTLFDIQGDQGNHLFLSYSHNDMVFAQNLKKDLEARGYTVWIDQTKIKGGEEWINSITSGVNQCFAMLSLVSQSANESVWVRREFLYAEQKKKPIIPIRVEDCELPIYMLDRNVMKGYETHYQPMLQSLLEILPPPKTIETRIPSPTDARSLEKEYLDRLWLKHKIWLETYTPMAGIAALEQQLGGETTIRRQSAHIPSVYDNLLANLEEHFPTEKRIVEEKFEDITQAVNKAKQLVILGDPGSGKTTTLWKLTAYYTQIALKNSAAPLPVLLELGSLHPHISVESQIQAQLGSLSFPELLNKGRLILLFDALNELPLQERFEKVHQVKQLVQLALKSDFIAVVTCREMDYQGELDLGIPQKVSIAPLDPTRILQFCRHHLPDVGEQLFWELAGGLELKRVYEKWQKAGASFDLFWTANSIRFGREILLSEDKLREQHVKNPRSLLRLARNPYMLFMINGVYVSQQGKLPRNRAQLFEWFVNYLLTHREHLAPSAASALKTKLSQLAFNMQSEGELRGTTYDRVRRFLSESEFRLAVSANLMLGGDEPRFAHQLLQEYFAAYGLDQARQQGQRADSFWQRSNWWEANSWDETCILMAGLHSDNCTPVVDWLTEANPELAARCILESGAQTPPETLEKLRSTWLTRLTNLKSGPQPPARAAIGRALAVLKLDNRKGVGLREDGLPDFDWVEVPVGEFVFGAEDENNGPVKIFLLAFQISRYPITYQQFQAFIDAEDGIQNERWWEGLAYQQQEPLEQQFKYWNHPRENVSWFQAIAFCRWLSAKLEYEITLPTEMQWEKAARGTDGRTYPWGNEFDSAKCHTRESGIGQTIAVGLYPQGASPYGLFDMSGNVWEWCLNEYDHPENTGLDGKATRALRGGASLWGYNGVDARVSVRDYLSPDFTLRDRYLGFRVCSQNPKL